MEESDEEGAKRCWIYETIVEAQDHFIDFFMKAREKAFYDAWRSLEQAELSLLRLKQHHPLEEAYCLGLMAKLIPQFQDIFPYAVFFSPGLVIRKRKCSICGRVVSAVQGCGHRKGYIYQGRFCCHIVEDVEPLEISFVKKPAQRFGVPFKVKEDGSAEDHYNYAGVDYVISGLRSPFSDWSYTRTKRRHPHSRYTDVSPNAPCPCGSGSSYEECCLPNKEGVLRPHIDIVFSEQPPASLPRQAYSDDWSPSSAGHAKVLSRQRNVKPRANLDPDM